MTEPTHHVPDAMLAAYAAGSLATPFAALVATHVTLCDECRARLDAHHALAGLVLDDLAPAGLAEGADARLFARLDEPPPTAGPADPAYPLPLARFVGPRGPRWRSLGFGARQAMLWAGAAGSIRLLSIPAGQAVPEHSHRGLELTLVLSGAFTDSTGRFGPGDLEVADETLDHTPCATDEGPCLCVAATDAPLRFRAILPRLFQPIFRI
ncbi:ChrR family anti-sigma-E factor [Amaricoccus sp. W119]|uniref:ChrR family anti-sigma-E factor n=1 Tax=Amaricoccus sp. W119 TaxID=3391833 RepID=UPI0039A7143A